MKKQDEQLVSLSTLGFFTFSLLHNIANQFTQLQFCVEEARQYLPPRQQAQLSRTTQYLASIVSDSQALLYGTASCSFWFDLQDAVLEALELSKFDLQRQQITVTHRLSPTLLTGNKVVFLQILLNLLKNSIQALESSSTRQISFSVKKKIDRILLVIEDSGPGLQTRPKFLQSTKISGSGVGLAYVQHHMISSFGGDFSLCSKKPGTGCSATLTFPRRHKGDRSRQKPKRSVE